MLPSQRAQRQSLRTQRLRNGHALYSIHCRTPQSHPLQCILDVKVRDPVKALGWLRISRRLVLLVQGDMPYGNELLPHIRRPGFPAQRSCAVYQWLILFRKCSSVFPQPFVCFWVGC